MSARNGDFPALDHLDHDHNNTDMDPDKNFKDPDSDKFSYSNLRLLSDPDMLP